jgi:hypothetical protein
MPELELSTENGARYRIDATVMQKSSYLQNWLRWLTKLTLTQMGQIDRGEVGVGKMGRPQHGGINGRKMINFSRIISFLAVIDKRTICY